MRICRWPELLIPFCGLGNDANGREGTDGKLVPKKRKINPSASYPSQKTGPQGLLMVACQWWFFLHKFPLLISSRVRTRPVTHLDVGPRPWVADDP